MMQIAPISNAGQRGPAKPAAYGSYVDWSRQEIVDGIYGEVVLIEDGCETICKLYPTPIRVEGAIAALRIWPKSQEVRG